MMFGFCREPFQDELLYGYVSSVFQANGYRTMEVVNKIMGFGRIGVDYAVGLPFLKERIVNRMFPNVDQMMRMLPGSGVAYVECALQPENVCFPKPATKSVFYVCPECMKADKEEYNEVYLHLSHQRGAKRCGVHGCGLKYASVPSIYKRFKPFDQYEYKDCSPEDDMVRADWQEDQYVWSVCGHCGLRYLEHIESRKRGTGCPFCNATASSEVIASRMLNAMYGGGYRLVPQTLGSLRAAVVEHVPCGSTSIKLQQLLAGKQVECKECKGLLPKYLQRRFDPAKREWVFLDTDEKERSRRRIRVLHRVCGRESYLFMPQFTSKGECGYCPICDNPQQRIEISDVDPEYEVIGDYRNNRESVQIKHRSCGLVFETSKTTFLAGARCPLCTPRYEFQDIQKAMAECCPDWGVQKESKRGFVSLIMPDGKVLSGYSYGAVMANLKAENSMIFPDKVKRWVDPVSLRKTIYDRIEEVTRNKGYWNFADGLDEITDPSMPGGVSRERRNIVQDMCRDGLIERCGRGCYRTVK